MKRPAQRAARSHLSDSSPPQLPPPNYKPEVSTWVVTPSQPPPPKYKPKVNMAGAPSEFVAGVQSESSMWRCAK